MKKITLIIFALVFISNFSISQDQIDETTIFVPNAFTPDGDGINDIFSPVFSPEAIPLYFQLVIWDTRGYVLFTSNDPYLGWHGVNSKNGGMIAGGIYVWEINFRYEDSDKKYQHVGHVTLLK